MPAHNQHVVISTGQRDWPSRIEDGGRRGLFGALPLARHLKTHLGPKGNWHDPYHNVMITNSSFPFWGPFGIWLSSVYLFPQFQFIPMIPSNPHYANFLAGMYLSGPNRAGRALPARYAAQFARIRDDSNRICREVSEVVVLICGHGGRDQRCGVMGPLLQTEFVRQLCYRGVDTSGCDGRSFPLVTNIDHTIVRARVALVSHIGGHSFAGNVIIYVPPSFTVEGRRSPLAGKGIWYGRVEPMHVEGIIEETIFKGRVIADLFRGGIEQGGNMLRL
ncbi:MAG: hypothetical protein FRX48_09046 [Lasallia pustulata]|nr:MAG: hypothetical protein FRX48_09046 [Lasallia pustulata]